MGKDDYRHDVAEKVIADTERWCARAAAMGEGYRLFRAPIRFVHDVTGYRAEVSYQILAPGEGAPATGHIFGPWPSPVTLPDTQAG